MAANLNVAQISDAYNTTCLICASKSLKNKDFSRLPRDYIGFIKSKMLPLSLLAYCLHAELFDSFVVRVSCLLFRFPYHHKTIFSCRNMSSFTENHNFSFVKIYCQTQRIRGVFKIISSTRLCKPASVDDANTTSSANNSKKIPQAQRLVEYHACRFLEQSLQLQI